MLKSWINWLKNLFIYLNIYCCIYESFKHNPGEVVSQIWTNNQKITKLINFALIIDAGKHFDFDKSDMPYFENDIVNIKMNEFINCNRIFVCKLNFYFIVYLKLIEDL